MGAVEKTAEKLLRQDLLSVYDGLLSLSGLPLMLAGEDGELLHEFVPMPDFCKYVCRGGLAGACPEYRRHLEGEAEYQCSRGLSCLVFPVTHEGKAAAYIVGGIAFREEHAYRKYMQDVPSLAEERELEPEFAAKALSLLQTVSGEKLNAHAQLCGYIAQNLALHLSGGRSPAQSVEKDILERKIIGQESKNSEIRLNPNFLFNMLNCVARIAYFEKAEKTENLIYQLSDLLRFNAQTGMTVHTVQAELEHIEKYLYIQKARFQARLRYVIEVPEHIRSCHILNSVLLPLVENALRHGIMLRKDGGEISLRAAKRGQHITFFIIDNGSGFRQDTLAALRAGGFLREDGGGLCRINRRLKQYYGDACGLDVVKSDSSGSTISVTIPQNITKR